MQAYTTMMNLYCAHRYCWYHYPYHYFDRGVWWYYMVELSFYWSLLGSQFYDVKRKDFW